MTALAAPDTPLTTYRLCAFVCAGGCVRPSPFEGWASFPTILAQRPDDCRFVIAENMLSPDSVFVCVDLRDSSIAPTGKIRMISSVVLGLRDPPARWVGNDPDALIMKAIALYDSEPRA